MYRLSDSGFMHRAFQEWIQSRVASEETCQAKEFPKAVSLIRIQSIFFAAGIGLGCSTLTLIAEVVWHMTRHEMRQR